MLVSFEEANLENLVAQNSRFYSISFKNARIKNCILNGNIQKIDTEGATFENFYINGKLFIAKNENKGIEYLVDS